MVTGGGFIKNFSFYIERHVEEDV